MDHTINIDGNTLTIDEVFNIVHNNFKIEFKNKEILLTNIKEGRVFLEESIKKGYPIYGVTTGFGDSCDNQISETKSEKLQESLVNFHGLGVGNNFNEKICRAVLLMRLNSNIKGYSGIRVELVNLMKEFLNRNISPVIPEIGSVGASGDLTPLSYLASTLMGKREVYYSGKIQSTHEVLEKENLKPLVLKAKEGLALMNGTSVMTAIVSLAWVAIEKISNISDFITAVTVGILNGNDIPFREKVSLIKNHPGQLKSSSNIYKIISKIKRVHKYENLLNKIGKINGDQYKKNDVKIQDRYSIRCSPQINGVLKDTLTFTKSWIENEINSANDNPLIDHKENQIYNSGNFYGGHISLACDYLRIAVANVADLSDKQSALIIDGKFNNLTENLIPVLEKDSPLQGLLHGFKAAQISISALTSEIQFLANPVSIHSRPTESLNQDKVSLGTISARKLMEVVELIYLQFSIHLLAVFQAVDLIGLDQFDDFTASIYKDIRELSKFLKEDRPLDKEILKVKEYLEKTTKFSSDFLN